MELPKAYNPKEVENRIYNLWQESGFFNPDKLPGKRLKSYTIVIPPPNITGTLHMGHALQHVIHDILIRQKRMQGFKALWLPGTDHAGIATQNVVERELKKEGLTRFDLGREKFIERVWAWQEKYGNIILEQLKKLGCSLDWSRTRFTMDKKYTTAVKTAFLHYYKKGWIYRGERVVNWCPRCQTSLSDLELEYKEEKGKLWYIKYPLVKISNFQFLISKQIPNPKSQIPKDFAYVSRSVSRQFRDFIVVATTRPETMLGDTAVAVNPKDKRYKELIGQKVILPIHNREIPIIADLTVDPKFGTGAVKVTPAHDQTDWEIKERHNLKVLNLFDENGVGAKESQICEGLKVSECRQKVIEVLEKENLIEEVEDYTHSLPYCYRCRTLVEPLLSSQWFLGMEELAKKAISAVQKGKIKFYPKRWEKIYFDWLKNIKDWCISRQIWWGHQLPVWQCQTGRISNFQFPISKQFKNSKFKIQNSSAEQFIVSDRQPEQCPFCKKCKMEQSADVLDTWFSSALWPFAALGWPRLRQGYGGQAKKMRSDLDRFYPTDILITDRGIINLWVTRMIFSGIEFMKKVPFKDVYIHATVLTREGKRMSKSLGTGIDPILLTEKYGADATRFGIAWQIMGGQDIRFVEDNIIMGRKFCNKLWNAARFVLMNKPTRIYADLERGFTRIKNLTSADKKILKALDKTIKSVNKDLEGFQFGKAARALYNFFWHDFCDRYIEESKKQPNEETKKILFYVLLNCLKLLHPFIPFITEEIYQKLPNKKKCLMIEEWPKN